MHFRSLGLAAVLVWGAGTAVACATATMPLDDPNAGGTDSGTSKDAAKPQDSGQSDPDTSLPPQPDSGGNQPDTSLPPQPDAAQAPDTSTPCNTVSVPSSSFDAGACKVNTISSVCAPMSVSKYVPSWVSPTAAHQNVCTTKNINDYYTACLDPVNQSQVACSNFATTYAKCNTCLLTKDTAPTWGPLIDHGPYVSVNVAGCIYNAESCNLACAKAVQASDLCNTYSCNSKTNCPITTNAQFTTFQTCVSDANKCLCKPYADQAACQGNLTGAASTVCTASDFATLFKQVGGLFCGQ